MGFVAREGLLVQCTYIQLCMVCDGKITHLFILLKFAICGHVNRHVHLCMLSEDEFAASKRLWRRSASAPISDMVKQLACDGYDLDLQPDDSDLDLIPPRPLNERRCLCCYNGSLQSMCTLQ